LPASHYWCVFGRKNANNRVQAAMKMTASRGNTMIINPLKSLFSVNISIEITSQ
jgi:hypothetical protein